MLFCVLCGAAATPRPLACRVCCRQALVYKISESCANKPQRRLHLIYLQQNVEQPKLLRKCNFALRVFLTRIRIRIRIHIRITWLVFNTFSESADHALFGDHKHERDGSKSIELHGNGKWEMAKGRGKGGSGRKKEKVKMWGKYRNWGLQIMHNVWFFKLQL